VVWLSLLLYIPISLLANPDEEASSGGTVVAYLLEATFMQTWFGAGVIGPLWSVCAQFFCYHWFPVIVGPFHTVRNQAR
jgi:peptidoglycan/LPS O-acetylase OafA/YrhL